MLSLEEVSLDDETESWRLVLRKGDSVGLIDYFRTKQTRLRLAVSLMALLELLRMGEVVLRDTVAGLLVERSRV